MSNDNIVYGNQFGKELEVSCKKAAVASRPQQLENEQVGKKVINLTEKKIDECNTWMICTADDPAAAEPVAAPEELSYDGEQLVSDIRDTLKSRGSMTLRGVARVFRILDDNKNRQLDPIELSDGLRTFGINLNDEQVAVLVGYFDRDNNKTVSLDEFLRALRVSNFQTNL